MTYRRIRIGQIGEDRVTDFAVQELVKYLKQMDPKLVVDKLQLDRFEPNFQNLIWVGHDPAFQESLPKVDDPVFDDAVCVQVTNSSGFITGTNTRSVLLAVYRFLKALGCDWVRPGWEGERIPAREVSGLNVSICEAASYRHRAVCIEGAVSYENVADMIDYIPKVGMNGYFVQFLVPGTFFVRWYQHEWNPQFEAEGITREEITAMTVSLETEISRRGLLYHKTGHGWTCEPFGIDGTSWDSTRTYTVPEDVYPCLAQVNGKRELWHNVPLNTNLCYSNPVVRQKMTDAIVEYCRNNSNVDILHLWLADGRNKHCECDNCQKKRPADWYVCILNELDEKLTAAGLNTRVVFLIYVDLLWEPVTERIRNQDRFILMFAPITRTYAENYTDAMTFDRELPPYVRNHLQMPDSLDQNLEHLRRWQKDFHGDSFCFDYHLMWAHMSDPGYEKCARNLFNDMRDLKDIGLNGMNSCQIQRCFFPTAMPFNMMAAALWNRDRDFDEAADAYYAAAFGEDGARVRSYMQTISDLFRIYDAPARTLAVNPACKDYDALSRLVAEFAPVIEKNIAAGGACREEWELLKIHGEYVLALMETFRMQDQGKTDEAQKAQEALLDLICRREVKAQKVLDVRNTKYVLDRRWGRV